MRQVLEASVVAHVLVAALQRGGRGSGEGVGPPRAAAADVRRVGDGVQAPVRQGRVGVERVQDLGEAGVQFGLTHVSSGYAVRGVAVAPYLSWKHTQAKARSLRIKKLASTSLKVEVREVRTPRRGLQEHARALISARNTEFELLPGNDRLKPPIARTADGDSAPNVTPQQFLLRPASPSPFPFLFLIL